MTEELLEITRELKLPRQNLNPVPFLFLNIVLFSIDFASMVCGRNVCGIWKIAFFTGR